MAIVVCTTDAPTGRIIPACADCKVKEADVSAHYHDETEPCETFGTWRMHLCTDCADARRDALLTE